MVKKIFCSTCKKQEYPYEGFCPVCDDIMIKKSKDHCPTCNSLIVNDKHYTVGKNTPAWTDKEIKLAEKFDKLHKEGKVTFRSIEID